MEGIAPDAYEDMSRDVFEMDLNSHFLLEGKKMNQVGNSKLCRGHRLVSLQGHHGSAKTCNLFSYFKQKDFILMMFLSFFSLSIWFPPEL